MADLVFTPANVETMVRLQRALSETLLRFNRTEQPEAMLAVFACLRVARELLNKYPERVRATTIDQVVVPFLRNEQDVGGDEGRIITLN